MIRSLCRISLNGPCGRRTGTTERRRRAVEEEEEEGEGGKSPDTLTQEKYVELKTQEGMPSSPLEGFLAPSQTKRQQRGRMMLIPRSKSPLHPQHTHHHTSPVSLSSHRVTVKLALPLSVCHVVSLLLCNFLFFPLLFPGKNVSPVAPPVSVKGLNSPFRCLTQLRSPRGA